MSYFFDVPRQGAEFHPLLFYINVFNKPQPPSLQATAGHAKGFILRLTEYQRANRMAVEKKKYPCFL
jgi:hypothetical protein